jgi:hypothetical protein
MTYLSLAGDPMGQLSPHIRSTNPLVQSYQFSSHRDLPLCHGVYDTSEKRFPRCQFIAKRHLATADPYFLSFRYLGTMP